LLNDERRAIKKSDGWWIGWLVYLPGVNAQERTKEELLKSLTIGTEDMLATQVPKDEISFYISRIWPTVLMGSFI
jgi:hypothetical protein